MANPRDITTSRCQEPVGQCWARQHFAATTSHHGKRSLIVCIVTDLSQTSGPGPFTTVLYRLTCTEHPVDETRGLGLVIPVPDVEREEPNTMTSSASDPPFHAHSLGLFRTGGENMGPVPTFEHAWGHTSFPVDENHRKKQQEVMWEENSLLELQSREAGTKHQLNPPNLGLASPGKRLFFQLLVCQPCGHHHADVGDLTGLP